MTAVPAWVDRTAVWHALERHRRARGVSWAQVAREAGVGAQAVARLRRGNLRRMAPYLALAAWLGRPLDAFVRPGHG